MTWLVIPLLLLALSSPTKVTNSRRAQKGKPVERVLALVPHMREAKKLYPNVPISLACAICENESGGDLNAVRWECRDPVTKKLYGRKTPCPDGHQRKDAKGRPIMSTGPWQFLIGTGEAFGLRSTIDPATDERRDPAKSTRAAFAFLSSLLNKWGAKGEAYAIAAYNAGSGSIAKHYPNIPNKAYVDHINAKRAKYRHLDAAPVSGEEQRARDFTESLVDIVKPQRGEDV